MNDSVSSRGSVIISAQYIKDLSFESPTSPYSLMTQEQPNIDVSLDINAQIIHEKTFEIVLSIRASANGKEGTIFIVDLHYAGLFVLEDQEQIDDSKESNNKEITLLVHCPNILFPYARRIISDVVRDGGFPPLMLAPIDFMSLYQQKKTSITNQSHKS